MTNAVRDVGRDLFIYPQPRGLQTGPAAVEINAVNS